MRLKTCILQARPIKFDPWGSFPTRGTDMISKSARRRIRRARTGGKTAFRLRQDTLRTRNKAVVATMELGRIQGLLLQGIKIEHDPVTKKFVSLRGARESLRGRIDRLMTRVFSQRQQSGAVTA